MNKPQVRVQRILHGDGSWTVRIITCLSGEVLWKRTCSTRDVDLVEQAASNRARGQKMEVVQ